MGREKARMELITNTKKRGITFRNRKESIIKKAFELSNLCDVNVAMIIYNDQQQQTPQIFPPDIDKFNNLINGYQKSRLNDPGKIRSHDLSMKKDIEKAKKMNLEGNYPTWFGFVNNFTEGDLRDFASKLDGKVDKVKTRIESIKKSSKIRNFETDPASTVIVRDDDDVEIPGPIQSMISPNVDDDYNRFGLFPGPNVENCDSLMTEEDCKNLGIDLDDELFSGKDGLVNYNGLLSEKEEDDNYWFDNINFSLETDPLPGFCFSPEMLQQHQQPESGSCCMEMNKFVMPNLSSHVMEYIT